MKTPVFSNWRSLVLYSFSFILLQTFASSTLLTAQCPTHSWSHISGPPHGAQYCYGDEITLTVQPNWNAVPPLEYEWYEGNTSNGPIIGTTQSINVIVTEGVFQYRVDVIDANGCVFPGHTNIFPVLGSTSLSSSSTSCGNTNNLYVYHYFGSGSFTYQWSTGATTENITANRGEIYSVTVTAPNGCTKVLTGEADFYPLANPEITGPPELCADISATLSVVATNPHVNVYNIEWSNGSSGSSSTNSSTTIFGPGSYAVTVSSSPGACTSTTNIVIPETPPVPPIIDHPAILCPEVEGQATVTNAAQYAEMNWFINGSGAQIPVLSNRTYTLNAIEPNGCESLVEFFVDEHFVVPPAIVAPNDICEGQETLTLEVATVTEEYLWSTGETTPTITTSSVGIYGVTTTDENGCQGEAELNLVAAELPEPSIPAVPAVCGGASQTLQVEGGPFESFEWSNGETTENIEVTGSGNYSVTVSNIRGCTGEAEAEVLISEGPEASIAVSENVCEGTAQLTASGGSTYEWSNGETESTLNVATSGDFTVTVTDDDGCTAATTASVALSAPPQVSVGGPSAFCEGNSVNLSASGNFDTYNWSNGESGASISVSQGGEYTVTATDANGCTDVASLTTTSDPIPEPQITAPNGFCSGASAELQLNGGFAEILWSNGETGSNITVSEAGNYVVTVTNASECTATGEVEIEEFSLPSANISGPSSFCAGSSAELSVGAGYSDIIWSTNESVSNITVSESGDYSVTVTNADGCTATDEMSVEAGSSLEPQLEMQMENCEPLATLSPGSGYTTYLWSNGETTESITVDNEGEYTVTVSNASGCSGEAMAEVTFAPAPTVGISGPNAICEGEMAQLSAASGFENYQWSTGETTADISVTEGGEYTLVATDPNGCTAEASFDFDVLALPSANISGPSTFCEGGSAELVVNGDFANIQWSTNENSSNITVSESGEYTVTVTDDNGCSATDNWAVETGSSLELEVGIDMENCAQSAALSVGGGFAQITWSNGATAETIQVDAAGEYAVTVTDASGCSGEAMAEVAFNDLPEVSLTGAPAACEGETIPLTADAGFSNYLWSTGETAPEIIISQPGEYTLIVTDANGCTAEASHQFEFLASPNAGLNGPASICTGNTAEFVVTGDFTEIIWNTGATTSSIQITDPGEYTATVTSADGCVMEVSQILEVGDELAPVISSDVDDCVAVASLDAGGGYENYQWSNGETGQSIEILEEGEYTVTVTDASGCTGEDLISVVLPTEPTVEIAGSAELCEGYEILLSASDNFVDYEWSTGETTAEISVSSGGEYSLVATNASGCTATAEWSVAELPTIQTELQMQSCNAQDTGTVTLALTSQTGCDSVVTMVTSLVPAITTNLTLNACAGEPVEYEGAEMQVGEEAEYIYSSFAGCDSIVTVSVAEWPNMSLEMESTASCWNTESGSLALNITSGDGPFLFSVNEGAFQAEPMFENLPTGEHTLTAEDAHGCLVEQLFEIGEIERTEISVNDGLLRCDEGTAILTPEVISGNPEMIEWQWSTGQTTMEMETTQPGKYELVAVDACEEQAFQVSVERADDENAGFFYVPNSFSPNGDDANDIFKVYTGSQTQIRSFEFQVFDRWGNRMFGTSNINEGWDGQLNGERKQIDVFVWYVKATVEGCRGEDVEIFQEGGVHLMK